jgi:hypothetical protein
MKKLFDKYNGRQTIWEHNNNYYICSTALEGCKPEVMVFTADSSGRVTDYMDLYVSYTDVTNHDFHMSQFAKENGNGS